MSAPLSPAAASVPDDSDLAVSTAPTRRVWRSVAAGLLRPRPVVSPEFTPSPGGSWTGKGTPVGAVTRKNSAADADTSTALHPLTPEAQEAPVVNHEALATEIASVERHLSRLDDLIVAAEKPLHTLWQMRSDERDLLEKLRSTQRSSQADHYADLERQAREAS